MLEAFLEEPKLKDCTSIKRVICSGEALTVELQKRFFTHLDAQLHNLYGPTEAAIDVTYYNLSGGSRGSRGSGGRKEFRSNSPAFSTPSSPSPHLPSNSGLKSLLRTFITSSYY